MLRLHFLNIFMSFPFGWSVRYVNQKSSSKKTEHLLCLMEESDSLSVMRQKSDIAINYTSQVTHF